MLTTIFDIAVVPLLVALVLLVLSFLVQPFYEQWYPYYYYRARVVLFGILVTSATIFYYSDTLIDLTGRGIDFSGRRVSVSLMVETFLISTFYATVLFHYLAGLFGHLITNLNLGRLSIFARNWAKVIDYVYLLISLLSLSRIVMSVSGVVTNDADNITVIVSLTVALSIALALRLTKTTIEILSWDKPRTSRPKWGWVPLLPAGVANPGKPDSTSGSPSP
jgi:hypothetical protein